MSKKVLLTAALIVLTVAVVSASELTAVTTGDSKVVILHDDGTWSYFERISYDQETGYSLSDIANFKNLQWEEGRLIKLGNWLNNSRSGLYSAGEFYLLQLKGSGVKTEDDATWQTPELSLSDGTTIKGFSSSMSQRRSYSTFKSLTGKSTVEYLYTVVFEVPSGLDVKSVDFKQEDSETGIASGLSELTVF